MISIGVAKNVLKIQISKGENLDVALANNLIRKGNRLVVQNRVTSVILEIENSSYHDDNALILLESTFKESYGFPVEINSSTLSI